MPLRLLVIATLIVAGLSSAAFAQFPPPGIYRCSAADGTPVGTLSLLVAGDYQFTVAKDASFAEKTGDPGNGNGQLASASTSVTAQSGPLADIYHWKGSFTTDAHRQHTSFKFAGTTGAVTCGVKG